MVAFFIPSITRLGANSDGCVELGGEMICNVSITFYASGTGIFTTTQYGDVESDGFSYTSMMKQKKSLWIPTMTLPSLWT